MGIQYHPEPGTILLCNFDPGFIEPEMVKCRPVIVISPHLKNRHGLVTIVACSTKEPNQLENYHYKLPIRSLPRLGKYQQDTWIKGDMIYTVGFHRLELIRIGKNAAGKRIYFTDRLGREQMKEIYACVCHGLNMGHVVQHI